MLTAKFVRGSAVPSIEGLKTLKTRSWITAVKVEHPDYGDRFALIMGRGLGHSKSGISGEQIGISTLFSEADAKEALEGYVRNNTNSASGLPEFIVVNFWIVDIVMFFIS